MALEFLNKELVIWPFGKAETQTPAYAAAIDVEVNNSYTVITPATLTGDATLNLTINEQMPVGSRILLVIAATTDGFDLTLGTGFTGPAIVGVAGKTKTQELVYDGTTYKPAGAAVQID
jgi:hypothetical protein